MAQRKNSAMVARVSRETQMLAREPPPGVCAWPRDDRIDQLLAQIVGVHETPFAGGIFLLEVSVPDRYPFEPPKVRFLTPIYHPNIDSGGRICLDTLKMPPKGSWTPSLNLSTVLTTVRLLMSRPNPDDGLVIEITEQYKHNRAAWDEKARQMTLTHATAERNATLQANLAGKSSDLAEQPAAVAPSALACTHADADAGADTDKDGTDDTTATDVATSTEAAGAAASARAAATGAGADDAAAGQIAPSRLKKRL
jgi:ubiquitin-conjugating enzyme E2 T